MLKIVIGKIEDGLNLGRLFPSCH